MMKTIIMPFVEYEELVKEATLTEEKIEELAEQKALEIVDQPKWNEYWDKKLSIENKSMFYGFAGLFVGLVFSALVSGVLLT